MITYALKAQPLMAQDVIFTLVTMDNDVIQMNVRAIIPFGYLVVGTE